MRDAHQSLLATRVRITPLLCGAASDATYAQTVRDTLLAAVPTAVVIDSFLGPAALVRSRTPDVLWVNWRPACRARAPSSEKWK